MQTRGQFDAFSAQSGDETVDLGANGGGRRDAAADETREADVTRPPGRERTRDETGGGGAAPSDHRRRAQRWASELRRRMSAERTVVIWYALTVLVGTAPPTGMPMTGFDNSWITAINMAAERGLRYGPEFTFNYGPWGFLEWAQYTNRGFAALGLLFSLAAVTALFATAFLTMRRSFSAMVSAVVAFLAAVATIPSGAGERLVCAGLLFGLLVLHRRRQPAASGPVPGGLAAARWPVVLASATSGLLLQLKFNEGVSMICVAGVLAVCAPGLRTILRNCAYAAGSFLGTFMVLWLIMGQRLGDIPSWLGGSWEISNGYQEALEIEQSGTQLGYPLAGILGVGALVAAGRLALRHRDLPTAGLFGLVLVTLEFGFKHGFIRHDLGHEVSFFVAAAAALIGLTGWTRRPSLALVGAVVALAMIPAGLQAFDPFVARNQWRLSLELLLYDESRAAAAKRAADSARAGLGISPAVLAAANGHPVHVEPAEATAVWAYGLDWRPAPVVQNYSAYTPVLDELNAAAMRNAPADQVVIRERNVANDDRNPQWDTPRYLLALACHYRVAAIDDRWMALRHEKDRCGPARVLGSEAVAPGKTVNVPVAEPGQIVVARFQVRKSALPVRAVQAVYKDWTPISIFADGTGYRVPEALADGPLLVSLPDSVGWPTPVRYSRLNFNAVGRVTFELIELR
jgi:hypothetical protein